MQTSLFIPDISNVNLLICRINKTCTIEDAYIVVENARDFPNSTIKVVNKKIQVYGKLCIFRSISIAQIIETLNIPDELQPEGLIFNSTFVKICCLTNNKMVDAFVLGCVNGASGSNL